MARTDHNWNHIHKGLLQLGFTQVITHNDKLYYKKGEYEVMLFKSNHIDRAVVEEICKRINVPYDYFIQMYKQGYVESLK
jgi:hypothetical protein